jgi:acetoin utilization deacetylase AcuC-like enzyme
MAKRYQPIAGFRPSQSEMDKIKERLKREGVFEMSTAEQMKWFDKEGERLHRESVIMKLIEEENRRRRR